MKKFVSILLAFMLTAATTEVVFGDKFEFGDIVEYKSLSSYIEPDALKLAVAREELPSVKQRLPKTPLVLKSKFMSDGPGVYGGVWRDFSAVPTEGWNWAAGQTQGYFGINQIVQEPLIRTGPMWLLREPEPVPNLATRWEWSENGKTLTMHLLKGAKWSDGVEFTTDDVLFTYYDCILDPHVPSWQSASTWTMDGKVTRLEKVDKYTIRFHFGIPFPIYIFNHMDYPDFSVAPKHILQKFHPKYNPDATYESFIRCLPPEDLPAVVLGPWVPVKYKPERILVMRRNPYYWQVDEAGRQLPYIDEIVFEKGRSGVTRTLNMIAGSCDHTNLETPGAFSFVMEQAQSPDAHFRVLWETYTLNFQINLNFALHKGVKTDRDLTLRKLFRNLKFRKALSCAIDREGIATSTLPGPMVRPLLSGFPSGAAYYDPDAVVKYEYNPAKAKSLLSELEFKDTDGDGILNWPEKTALAGQNLIVTAIVSEDITAAVRVGEALVPILREMGIKLNLKPLKGPVNDAKVNAGEFEMNIVRPDTYATPFIFFADLGPVTLNTPIWHQAGTEGKRELLPFEVHMKELLEKVKTEVSAKGRAEIFSEIQYLWTENLYTIGVIEVRRGGGVAKRARNVPEGCPTRLYQWWWTNVIPQQLWIPKNLQLPQQFPNLIPTYKEK